MRPKFSSSGYKGREESRMKIGDWRSVPRTLGNLSFSLGI